MSLFNLNCPTCRARIHVHDRSAIHQVLACPRCQSMVEIVPPADWKDPELQPAVDSEDEDEPAVEERPPPPQGPTVAVRNRRVMLAAAGLVCFSLIVIAMVQSRGRPVSTPVQSGAPAGAGDVNPPVPPGEQKAPLPENPAGGASPPSANGEAGGTPPPPLSAGPGSDLPPPPPEIAPELPPLRRWLPAGSQWAISLGPRAAGEDSASRKIVGHLAPELGGAIEGLCEEAGIRDKEIRRITCSGLAGGRALLVVETAKPVFSGAPADAPGQAAGFAIDGRAVRVLAGEGPSPATAWIGTHTVASGSMEAIRSLETPLPELPAEGLASRFFADGGDGVTLLWTGTVPPASSGGMGGFLDRLARAACTDQIVGKFREAAVGVRIDYEPAPANRLVAAIAGKSPTELEALRSALILMPEDELAPGADADDAVRKIRDGLRKALSRGKSAVRDGGWLEFETNFDVPGEALVDGLARLPGLSKPDWTALGATNVEDPPPDGAAPDPAGEPASEQAGLEQVAAQLAFRIPSVEITNAKFSEVMETLEDMSTIDFNFDLEGMAEAGAGLDDPVSLRLANTTVRDVLEAVLRERGLDCVVERGQIVITNSRRANASRTQAVYDVSDLASDPAGAADLAVRLQNLIEPGTWKADGGEGTCRAVALTIEVDQNTRAHGQLAGVLDRLRLARGVRPRLNEGWTQESLVGRLVRCSPKLAEPVTANFVRETLLDRIIAHLARQSQANIMLDGVALASEGISIETPATLTATKKPLGECLDELLAPLGLVVRVLDAESFVVTTPRILERSLFCEFYPVSDLTTAQFPPEALMERVRHAAGGVPSRTGELTVRQTFDAPSGHLLVNAPQPVHALVLDLLETLRASEEKAEKP
jgi:hypothetical protein